MVAKGRRKIRDKAPLLAIVVPFLAILAAGAFLPRWFERRQTAEVFRWCTEEIPKHNYFGYRLAEMYAHRFDSEQISALLEVLEREKNFEGEYYAVNVRPYPPEHLLEGRTLAFPGLRSCRLNRWADGSIRLLRDVAASKNDGS